MIARISLALLAILVLVAPVVRAAEVGVVRHGEIAFRGTVETVEPDRVLLSTSSGPRLWVSAAAEFLMGGREIGADRLQAGDAVVARIPAGNSAVLGLNSRILSLQTDVGPVDLPVVLLDADTLASSRVEVRAADGARSAVSLREALDLVRHAGVGVVAATDARVVEPVVGRADLTGTSVSGTVRAIGADEVTLQNGVILPSSLAFRVDDAITPVGQLRPGSAVNVILPATSASVVSLDRGLVALRTEAGTMLLPPDAIPDDIRRNTRVRVRGLDGTVSVISLQEALDVEGTTLIPEEQLGAAPALDSVAPDTARGTISADVTPTTAAVDPSISPSAVGSLNPGATGSASVPATGTVDVGTAGTVSPVDEPLGAAPAPGTISSPSTGALTGLGTLSPSSTPPSVGIGTVSTSSTGTQVGVGTANVSGSASMPADDLVQRGPDSAAAVTPGELNLTAIQVLGTILEAGENEVILRTSSGSAVSVPAHFRFVGANGLAAEVAPEMDVTVEIPAGSGPILALGNGVVSVALPQGVVSLPLNLLPDSARTDTRVWVETANGLDQQLNLGDAMTLIQNGQAVYLGEWQ